MRGKLADGILNMLQATTSHPVLQDLSQHIGAAQGAKRHLLQKVLILGALAVEPNFVEHMFTLDNVCKSTLSQFIVHCMQPEMETFLCGNQPLEEFVLTLTHAYISL